MPPRTTQSLQINGPHPQGWLTRTARWLLVFYWPALLYATHFPKTKKPEPEEAWTPIQTVTPPDKLNHLVAFSLLMLLLVLAGPLSKGRSWVGRCLIALTIGATYAAIDEITQRLAPGRDVDPTDLLANIFAVLGVYILAILPNKREPGRRSGQLVFAFGILLIAHLCLLLIPPLNAWAVNLVNQLSATPDPTVFGLTDVLYSFASAILTVMLIVIGPMSSRSPRFWAGALMLALIAFGPLVEIAQHLGGRPSYAKDLYAHGIGVLMAMIWWAIVLTRSPKLRQPTRYAPEPSA